MIAVSVLVAVVAALTLTVSATAQGPGSWTEYSSNPVFGQWVGGPKAYYPSVLYDADSFSGHGIAARYKMWYGTTASQTALATSSDGITWTNHGVVMSYGYHATVEYYADGFAGANTGGTTSSDTMYYRMWYWDPTYLYSVSAIAYTESPDGVNWYNYQPCQNGAVPIVSAGDPWWNRGSYGPCDILYNSGASNTGADWTFTMYYDGTTGGDEAIGLGFSSDGITWTGYDADHDGKADPVLAGTYVSGDWDYNYISRATVIKNADDDYEMWYSGGTGAMNHGIGYATSSDGINWARDPGNPILHKSDAGYPAYPWRQERTYCPMVTRDGSVYKMWFAGRGSAYSIGYATATLPPAIVYVDDDYYDAISCAADGHTWQVDCFDVIQDGVNAVVPGGTVFVAAGTYDERITIDKSLDLRGAQYGVDPTPPGARTTPASESILDITGLSVQNPNVAVEVSSGATNVSVGGFTLIGSPTFHYADESIVRCWDDGITIQDNIMDGYIGVLYKGADDLTVHRNRLVVNKNGVVVQPNPASNVTVSDNVFNLGPSPAGDESAIYMTSCSECLVSGNTAAGFINGKGVAGSNLANIAVSGNTFSGNKDGVSFWGNTTFITIDGNELSSSLRYGISIKGQDIEITGNEIRNNADTGINIARHVIDTERVEIHQNNIAGNTNYGVKVDTASVVETVNATCNWWGAADGPSSAGPGSGDSVSSNVDFQPWLTQAAPSACDYEGPITSDVIADPDPVSVGSSVHVTADVDDSETGGSDIASAEYSLDGGAWAEMDPSDGSFDEENEHVTGAFLAPTGTGIYNYTLCVRGTDEPGNAGPETCIGLMLVVYDPDGGFVTGGGWIYSEPGAYLPDPELEGKASFGFVSKYKKGASVPEGNTEFQFKAADLNFHSDSYEWLVVNQGGTNAQFKGGGTINGELAPNSEAYKFMLWAGDGEPDTFRIKIWWEENETEHVVYDNGFDQAIGGGSIVVHTKK